MLSRGWNALMRRNFIYRKRHWMATLAEFGLPIFFCYMLVLLKHAANKRDHFKPVHVDATFPPDMQTMQILSFTDYVKALQAKRICLQSSTSSSNYTIPHHIHDANHSQFDISGMPHHGQNWQVPFIQCDSRHCRYHGEEAYQYCHYPKLALAPSVPEDPGGSQRATKFRGYLYQRYPQLQNKSLPAFQHADFVQLFESNAAVEEYTKHLEYGKDPRLRPKLAMAIVFTGDDGMDYRYSIRVNSTNQNAPEWAGSSPSTARTTPDTNRLFAHFAKREGQTCAHLSSAIPQSPLQYSCTGQYILNGLLTMQRFLHDWIMVDTGAKDIGMFVAEHGVKFLPFPSRPYEQEGFFGVLNEFMPLFFTLGMLYPCASMISYIAEERETGQKEFLKIMSVQEWEIGCSWFCTFSALHFWTAICLTFVSAQVFVHSEITILWIFWQSSLTALIVFSSCLTSLLSARTKTATRTVLAGLLISLAGYFVTNAVKIEENYILWQRFFCLHPIAAMSYGIQEIGRLEDAGVGVTWNSFHSTDSPSGFTFLVSIQFLLGSCLLWTGTSWYFNRFTSTTHQGCAFGCSFPFCVSYWFPACLKRFPQNPEVEQIPIQSKSARIDENIHVETVSDALKQQARDGSSVEIHNLRKVYSNNIGSCVYAVNGLNLSLYRGQITALLGHNGSGKSTTINMLTGSVKPTEGFIKMMGKDSRTEMAMVREELGLCMQQNDCLFPKLTVQETIQFYCRVKGVYDQSPEAIADEKVHAVIKDLGLSEKRHSLSMQLSGGMKRKLCVAIAFSGNSKVVILDEPTAGMDPQSRRLTWEVIRRYRRERTILFTTHFLDEADILADKIAILANGQLRCVGSPLFLKKMYGVGYHLTIEKGARSGDVGGSYYFGVNNIPDEAPLHVRETDLFTESKVCCDERLKTIVKSAVPEASLLTNAGKEISFQLPISSPNFGLLFTKLDSERNSGKIASYGINTTTLDEVFHMVVQGRIPRPLGQVNCVYSVPVNETSEESKFLKMNEYYEIDRDLFWKHIKALLRKRWISFKRDKKAWCFTTIMPSLFVLLGFVALKYSVPVQNLEPLQLNLSAYNDGTYDGIPRNPIMFNLPHSSFRCQPGWCSYQHPINQVKESKELYFFCGAQSYLLSVPDCSIDMSNSIMRWIDGDAIGKDVSTMNESSHKILETSGLYPTSQYGAVLFIHEPNSTTNKGLLYGEAVVEQCQNFSGNYMEKENCQLYDGFGYVISYNFTALHVSPLFQALADEAFVRSAFNDHAFRISPTVHPLPLTDTEARFTKEDDVFNLWFMIVLSFPFIAGYMGNFVLIERKTKAKLLQTISGASSATYWASTFFWDITNYQFVFWATISMMLLFDVDVFTTSDRHTFAGVVALLFLFGPAAASFAYCLSFCFTSASLCSMSIIMVSLLTGFGGPIVTYSLRLIGSDPEDPWEKLVHIAKLVECMGRFVPSFCLGKGLFYTINISFFDLRGGTKTSVWNEEILLYEVIALGLQPPVYLAAAICLDKISTNGEAKLFWKDFISFITCQCRLGQPYMACDTDILPDDSDVLIEQERVLSGEADNEPIVIQQLRKQYSTSVVAVKDLSFAIPPGECFGLLGTNGAGKTTTMEMLTSELAPTSGDILLANHSVVRESDKTRRRIGYCPQFDSNLEYLTGREHLQLYASLKGIPSKWVSREVNKKLAEVGLSPADADRLSSHYSGGMKRKLSIACATIGDPQIIFFDEPSTGVDPVARREIWKMISNLTSRNNPRTQQRASVILTTHSMDECEALCSRIAIMVRGTLRCLGTAQHLKSKFGSGYRLEFKIKPVEEIDDDFIQYTNIVARFKVDASADIERGTTSAEKTSLNLEETRSVLTKAVEDDSLLDMLATEDGTKSFIFNEACSPQGVSLVALASFITLEMRIRNLDTYVRSTFAGATHRERQDLRVRYVIPAGNVSLASVFTSIEENKKALTVTESGLSQTTLEEVFSAHAS